MSDTIREHLAGHMILPPQIVSTFLSNEPRWATECSCGWAENVGSEVACYARHCSHLESEMHAALALLDQADRPTMWIGGIDPQVKHFRLVPDPVVGPGLDNTKGTQ